MIGFGAPLLLFGIVCVPVVWFLVLWGNRRRRAAQIEFAGGAPGPLQSGRISPVWRGVKTALLLCSIALAAFALARLQVGQTNVVLPREGSDVIVAIDVSRSMEVSDVKPTRLDVAKQSAKSLISHLGGDRVGLVAFAGSATLRFPLTTDDAAARQVVDSLAIGDSGVKPGTDLGEALATSRGAFTGDKTRSKVVVLISDGEDLSNGDLAAVNAATNDGIMIHTVGIGTAEGGEVSGPDPRTGRIQQAIDPATGRTAISHRNDANLRQIAATGHGTAYDGNTTEFAFNLSTAIDSLAKTQFNAGVTRTPIERFQIPLALALALLVLELVIVDSGEQVWQRIRAPRHSRAAAATRGPVPNAGQSVRGS